MGQEVAKTIISEYDCRNTYHPMECSSFASGVYYYRIITDNFTKTNKLLLLK